jgi:hypothetical protein
MQDADLLTVKASGTYTLPLGFERDSVAEKLGCRLVSGEHCVTDVNENSCLCEERDRMKGDQSLGATDRLE